MRLTFVQADYERCYSEGFLGGALIGSAGFDCQFPETALVLHEGGSNNWQRNGFPGAWLAVDHNDIRHGTVVDRSHYSGCVYDCGGTKSPAAFVERLVASVWVNYERLPRVDDYYGTQPEDWWVWP